MTELGKAEADKDALYISIAASVERWLARHGLTGWTVEWEIVPTLQEQGANLAALTLAHPGMKKAHILLSQEHIDHRLDFIVGHELAHVVLQECGVTDAIIVMNQLAEEYAPPPLASALNNRLHNAVEDLCDRMAAQKGEKDEQ